VLECTGCGLLGNNRYFYFVKFLNEFYSENGIFSYLFGLCEFLSRKAKIYPYICPGSASINASISSSINASVDNGNLIGEAVNAVGCVFDSLYTYIEDDESLVLGNKELCEVLTCSEMSVDILNGLFLNRLMENKLLCFHDLLEMLVVVLFCLRSSLEKQLTIEDVLKADLVSLIFRFHSSPTSVVTV
jgi:hypothetical protein